MADLRKKSTQEVPAKYAEQFKNLAEMGFDSSAIIEALDSTNGNLEAATSILLGEPEEVGVGSAKRTGHQSPGTTQQSAQQAVKVIRKLPTATNTITPTTTTNTAAAAAAAPVRAPKQDIREQHNKFMATYKVQKCKEKANHDKRMCMYWHTKGDRRRNPFELPYTCQECPTYTETNPCEDGDNCMKAHNMLERMFHPELFKISMCQRGPSGSHCERGGFCAFAHSDEDHRIPMSQYLRQQAAVAAAAANAASAENLQPGKVMSDSRLLDGIQDKLVRLIKSQGTEGIISSELPKRYYDVYSERLELTDEAGEKFRIKDLLLQHGNINVTMHKGVQPKYVYDETKPPDAQEDPSLLSAGNSFFYSSASSSPPSVDTPIMSSSVVGSAVAAAGSNDGKAVRRRGPSAPMNAVSLETAIPGGATGVAPLESLVPERSASVTTSPQMPSAAPGLTLIGSTTTTVSGVPKMNDNYPLPPSLASSTSIGSAGPSLGPLDHSTTLFGSQQSTILNGFESTSMNSNNFGLNEPSSDPLYSSFGNSLGHSLLGFDTISSFSSSTPLGFGGLGLDFGSASASNSATSVSSHANATSANGILGSSVSNAPLLGNSNASSIGARRRGPAGPIASLNPEFNTLDLLGTSSTLSPGHAQALSGSRGEINQSIESSAMITDLTEKLAAANKNCATFKDEIAVLKREILHKQDEYEDISAKLSSATARLQQSDAAKSANAIQWAEIQKQLAAAKESIQLKDDELKLAKEALKEKETALNKAELTRNSLVPELKQLRTKLASMESDLNHGKEKYQEQERSKNKLHRELDEARAEISSLRSGKGSEEQVQSLRAQLQKTQRELAESNRIKDFLSDQVEKTGNELKAMVGIEKELRQLSQDAMNSKAAMQAEIEALRVQINQSVLAAKSEVLGRYDPGSNAATTQSSSTSASSPSSSSSSSTGKQGSKLTGDEVDSDIPSICSLPGCNLEGPYICSRCGKTGYCGLDHQREHWRIHRKECASKKPADGK